MSGFLLRVASVLLLAISRRLNSCPFAREQSINTRHSVRISSNRLTEYEDIDAHAHAHTQTCIYRHKHENRDAGSQLTRGSKKFSWIQI